MQAIKTPVKEIELREIDGSSKVFQLPGQVYGLSKFELQAVRNTIEPFRIGIEIFDLVDLKIPHLTFGWPTIMQGVEVIQVVDIIENVGYIHTVTPHVIKSATTRYTIARLATSDNRVQNGVQIARFEPGIPCPASELPIYTSLRKLKKLDPLFQELTTKQKQKVLKESNIHTVMDMIIGKTHQLHGDLVQHLFLGSFKKGRVTGVHHILAVMRGNVRIVEITKPPNKLGVWEAKIQVLDKSNRQSKPEWKTKNQPSTFFPNWITMKLLDECDFALKAKEFIREKHSQTLWKSKTSSGIPVEIWTDDKENPISIYPIWEGD